MRNAARLLLGTSLITLTLAGASQALAQTSPPAQNQDPGTVLSPETTSVDDIIVTAQRRSERLQDVPLTMSAFGSEAIAEAGIASLTQIAPRVPGFYGGSAGQTRPQLYIRGVGTRSFDAGSEASVGVFVDDVYLGRAAGTLGALRDIERIEVLKGPQGTLYGRNTIAGAINIATKGPTEDFEYEAEAGIGNYNAYNLFGAVSGPLVDDKILARASVWRTYADGYMENITTGNTAQGIDHIGGRLRLEFRPNENLTVGLIAELLHDDGYSFAGENEGSAANPNSVFLARPGAVTIRTPDRYSEAINGDSFLERDVNTYSARADLVTNVSLDDRDFDNTQLDVTRQASDEDSGQFTQEFRLTSETDGPFSMGGRFDYLLGLFYYKDDTDRIDTFNFGPDSVIAAARGGARQTNVVTGLFETESLAAFAQFSYRFNEQWELTLGGRYSEDTKTADFSGTTTSPGLPLIPAAFSVPGLRAEFASFDPRVSLSYQPNPDLNFYASYNQGFKSGGFQYLPFNAGQAGVVFNPESLDAFEAGFKTQLFDRRLTFNGAAYYYSYDDLQVLRVVPLPPPAAAATLITNAATSIVKGAEIELVARPADGLEFNFSYAYTDAKYDSFPVNATTDFSDTRLPRAPENSMNLGVRYTIPLGNGADFETKVDYAHLSEFFFEPGEIAREPGYGLTDVRATYRKDGLRISAFVTNATDEYYRRTVLAAPGQLISYPGPPRMFGITIGIRR